MKLENEVMSTTRYRRATTGSPVLLVNRRRILSVPNVPLLTDVKSRTRFGAADGAFSGSMIATPNVEFFWIGALVVVYAVIVGARSGPGAPRMDDTPFSTAPVVSTSTKSAALLLVS